MVRKCIKDTIVFVVVLVIVIITIVIIALSLVKVESQEVGLQYDKTPCYLHPEPKTMGLHVGTPVTSMITFSSVYKDMMFDISCFNEDFVKNRISVTTQYRVRQQNLTHVVLKLGFKDNSVLIKVLQYTGQSVIYQICSQYNTTQFKSDRNGFGQDIKVEMQSRFNRFYTDVIGVQVNNIGRPEQYEEAVNNKENARQNIQVKETERMLKIIQANTSLQTAIIQARITLDRAHVDSEITRMRAQVEAEAIVFQYKTEGELYKLISSTAWLNLTDDYFINYVAIRSMSSLKNPVYVALTGPAKTSYVIP